MKRNWCLKQHVLCLVAFLNESVTAHSKLQRLSEMQLKTCQVTSVKFQQIELIAWSKPNE